MFSGGRERETLDALSIGLVILFDSLHTSHTLFWLIYFVTLQKIRPVENVWLAYEMTYTSGISTGIYLKAFLGI